MREYKIEDGVLMVKRSGRVNAGECLYCRKPVFISPGQIITYAKIIKKNFDEIIEVKEYPTHKACRKNYEKENRRCHA